MAPGGSPSVSSRVSEGWLHLSVVLSRAAAPELALCVWRCRAAKFVMCMHVRDAWRQAQHEQRLSWLSVCGGAVVLVCAGCFSSTTTEGIKMYTMFGAAFLFASNLAIVICLPLVAPVHQPASFVFSRFYSADTSGLGIPNDACASPFIAIISPCTWNPELLRSMQALSVTFFFFLRKHEPVFRVAQLTLHASQSHISQLPASASSMHVAT